MTENKNSKGFKVLPPAKQLAIMKRIAAEAHVDQVDAQGDPYILHCDKVMHYVRKFDEDDYERMVIAVGHDLIEDTKVKYAQLYNVGLLYPEYEGWGFSDRSINGIRALTNVPGETEEEVMERILPNVDACIVKALGDLRHNTDIRRGKGLRQKDFDRLVKYHTRYHRIKTHLREVHGIHI